VETVGDLKSWEIYMLTAFALLLSVAAVVLIYAVWRAKVKRMSVVRPALATPRSVLVSVAGTTSTPAHNPHSR
jgi:hypothetical protein